MISKIDLNEMIERWRVVPIEHLEKRARNRRIGKNRELMMVGKRKKR